MHTERYWYVPSPHNLRLLEWEGEEETIVYRCVPGDLHLLNPVAAMILKLLLDRQLSTTDLRRNLSANGGSHSGQLTERELEVDYLRRLYHADLVRARRV